MRLAQEYVECHEILGEISLCKGISGMSPMGPLTHLEARTFLGNGNTRLLLSESRSKTLRINYIRAILDYSDPPLMLSKDLFAFCVKQTM